MHVNDTSGAKYDLGAPFNRFDWCDYQPHSPALVGTYPVGLPYLAGRGLNLAYLRDEAHLRNTSPSHLIKVSPTLGIFVHDTFY